jgi:prepilin-type processing-associated H-X9-DG protein
MFARTTPTTPAATWTPERRQAALTIKVSSVADGTSNTLFIGETLPEFCEFQRYIGATQTGWPEGGNTITQGQTIQPINYRIERDESPIYVQGCTAGLALCRSGNGARCLGNWAVTWGFKSNHSGGANFAFVDGSVRFIQESIDMRTYQYLGHRTDGQPVTLP